MTITYQNTYSETLVWPRITNPLTGATLELASGQLAALDLDPGFSDPHLQPIITVFQGVWDSVTRYVASDEVQYGAVIYIALRTSTNKVPALEPTYWQSVAASNFMLATNNLGDITDASTGRMKLQVPALTAACVATSNVASLTGLGTYDGYTLDNADLILLTGQTDSTQNGLWRTPTIGNGAWARPPEFVSGMVVSGRSCAVLNGTIYAATTWILQAPTAGVTVDTTAQTWTQSGSGSFVPLGGGVMTGNLGLGTPGPPTDRFDEFFSETVSTYTRAGRVRIGTLANSVAGGWGVPRLSRYGAIPGSTHDSGTATATTSTTLTDSGKAWAANSLVGYAVWDTTTKDYFIIKSNTATMLTGVQWFNGATQTVPTTPAPGAYIIAVPSYRAMEVDWFTDLLPEWGMSPDGLGVAGDLWGRNSGFVAVYDHNAQGMGNGADVFRFDSGGRAIFSAGVDQASANKRWHVYGHPADLSAGGGNAAYSGNNSTGTPGSVGALTLLDNNAAWTVNQWIGYVVRLGGYSGLVVSNTATQLNLATLTWLEVVPLTLPWVAYGWASSTGTVTSTIPATGAYTLTQTVNYLAYFDALDTNRDPSAITDTLVLAHGVAGLFNVKSNFYTTTAGTYLPGAIGIGVVGPTEFWHFQQNPVNAPGTATAVNAAGAKVRALWLNTGAAGTAQRIGAAFGVDGTTPTLFLEKFSASYATTSLQGHAMLYTNGGDLVFGTANGVERARFTAAGVLTFVDALNIALGTTTGTKIGTLGGGSGQKLGFFNATPVVQPLLATGAAHTVDDVITTLQTLGLVRQT